MRSTEPELVNNVDSQQLQVFRDTYGSRSFHCRYTACVSSVTGFTSEELRNQHEATHVWKYKCKVLNCFMGKRGFRKQHELKLHCQKYHPVTRVPELVLPPSLTPTSLSSTLEGLTIAYAPDVEQSFSVELLYQFKFHSVCCSTAISPDLLFFATATNRFVHLCSLKTEEEVWRFDMGGGEPTNSDDECYFRDVTFSPDGLSLVAASESGRIMVSY